MPVEERSPGSGMLQNETETGIDMSLEPDQVERLRKKLYEKAKQEPDFRFYSLYDKVCWAETLAQAYRQAKANAGAAGVDGVRFEDIES